MSLNCKKMETESTSDRCGSFQELRNMWNFKTQVQQSPSQPTSVPVRPPPEQKRSLKDSISIFKITTETVTLPVPKKDPLIPSNNDRTPIFESVEKLPPIEEHLSLPVPPPPPSIIFQHQAQSVARLKQTVSKMEVHQKKNILRKNTAIHHWHITRHVFRSGLIFSRTRRASDSILPLLMKTHISNHRPRADSLDSTLSQTPFESRVDYITYDKDHDKDSLAVPMKMKRSASDASDCIRRNKLDDSIFQYEMILRHLKNYEQFMTTYPAPLIASPLQQREHSVDGELNSTVNETEAKFLARASIPNRQTQSLSRNVGRTFSEFIMNDLFPISAPSKSPSKEHRQSITDASSQTDTSEPSRELKDPKEDSTSLVPPAELHRSNSITNEETKAVLNELDTVLDDSHPEPTLTPNSEINVVVVNSPVPASEPEVRPTEKPLMQRLFEGKKTAYSPADHHMESLRLPEEMMPTYETAKKKCFFDTEELIYAAKMIKISRRGYSQHVRMLCITTERIYNITKRDPYPKEALLFADITGITCTPYKDGFMCIHTREVFQDRGDWLVVVDHPCEFITRLFMTMGRDNNDDRFLKFETKFTHCRRCLGEVSSSDCSIEARLSDTFRIKKAEFDSVIIYTT